MNVQTFFFIFRIKTRFLTF